MDTNPLCSFCLNVTEQHNFTSFYYYYCNHCKSEVDGDGDAITYRRMKDTNGTDNSGDDTLAEFDSTNEADIAKLVSNLTRGHGYSDVDEDG